MLFNQGITLFLLITVPWHIAVQAKNPEFFYFYFIEQQFTRYLTNYAGRYKPFWFFIPIIIIGLFPWICFSGKQLNFIYLKAGKIATQKKNHYFYYYGPWLFLYFFAL